MCLDLVVSSILAEVYTAQTSQSFMYQRKLPICLPAIACIAGIGLTPYLHLINHMGFLVLLAALLIYVIAEWLLPFPTKRPLLSGCLLWAAVCLGTASHHRIIASRFDENLTHLVRETPMYSFSGQLRDVRPTQKDRVRCIIELLEMRNDTFAEFLQERALVYIKLDSANPPPIPGQILTFRGRLIEIGPPLNPGAFDLQKYYRQQGIRFKTYLNPGDYILTMSQKQPFWVRAHYWRMSAVNILEKAIPNREHGALVKAMTLGYREDLDRSVREDFSKAGVMHVLAVSGLHVGIVFTLVYFVIGLPGRGSLYLRCLKMLVYILVTGAYAVLTGLSPSVLRATLMLWVFLLGYAMVRKNQGLNSLALAAMLLLLVDPMQIYSVSFQFSFLAVAGILIALNPILRQFPVKRRIPRYCMSAMAMSLSAQIFLLPLLAFYFNQVSLISLVSSIPAIPLCFIVLCGGLLTLGIGLVSSKLASFTGYIPAISSDTFIRISEFLATLPGAYIAGISITAEEVWLLLASTCLSIAWVIWRKTYLFLGCMSALGLLVGWRYHCQTHLFKTCETLIYANRTGLWMDTRHGLDVFTLKSKSAETPFGRQEMLLSWHTKQQDSTLLTTMESSSIARQTCSGIVVIDPGSIGKRAQFWNAPVSALVLTGKGYWNLQNLPDTSLCPTIILGSDLDWSVGNLLENTLRKKGFKVHNIRNAGAYVYTHKIQ